MPVSISMMIVSTQLVVAVADNVPKFDIARSCKLDVAATAGLSVEQSLKSCINDEQQARRQLASRVFRTYWTIRVRHGALADRSAVTPG